MDSISSFDPTSLEYQVDKEFAPDKTVTWTTSVEEDAWVLGHKALRGELDDLLEALEKMMERGGHSEWERKSVQSLWDIHAQNTRDHHKAEKNVLFPNLQKRFISPSEVKDYFPYSEGYGWDFFGFIHFFGFLYLLAHQVTSNHDNISEAVEKLDAMVKTYCAGNEKEEMVALLPELVKALKEYQSLLQKQFQDEEDTMLRLCRAYFEPMEVGAYRREMMSGSSKMQMGSFVHYAFPSPQEFRTNFMSKRGMPSFVWHMKFGPAYGAFSKVFVKNMVALKGDSTDGEHWDQFANRSPEMDGRVIRDTYFFVG
eukprot:CAMPEP_0116860980 /NCGR_PEP_ID=MMETSP0418-20121206/22754_1 /TAXON_ID=1158023 /ORGANISM="Astrosyne radiata, Strain 13vi08-1A" /LENGTH=311 /DNA_ID=CAMNT_0004495523 /DNA_START=51 /DNA_END=986 /DNA_ORIENTATION=+